VSKIIVYTGKNDKLIYVLPATNDLTIEEIAEKDVPENTPYHIIEATDLPSDRTYRDAWIWNNGVVIDENKKLEIDNAIENKINTKAALLERLGITEDEARLLLA